MLVYETDTNKMIRINKCTKNVGWNSTCRDLTQLLRATNYCNAGKGFAATQYKSESRSYDGIREENQSVLRRRGRQHNGFREGEKERGRLVEIERRLRDCATRIVTHSWPGLGSDLVVVVVHGLTITLNSER